MNLSANNSGISSYYHVIINVSPFFYFQASEDQLVKVQFSKFLLGNYSDGCPNDYVEVDGRRSVHGNVLQFQL